VISTLNVQHLESLYDTVEQVTRRCERIPDGVAEADQIVNVDITTEDLRRRLEEGKVYTTERIETALTHFFKQSNLEQLRELTLRELAAQIDSRHRTPRGDDVPSSPDQVMVCLSSRSPNSEALLRYASRLAGRLNRNWYAVYVQTSSESPTKIDSETQRVLSNALTLAQQLGATVFTYKGDDVVKTLFQFAKEYRVGHIVVGRSGQTLPLWQRLSGKATLIQRLVEEAKGITVVVLDTAGRNRRGRSGGKRRLKRTNDPAQPEKPSPLSRPAAVLLWYELMERKQPCGSFRMLPGQQAGVEQEAAGLIQRATGSTFLGGRSASPCPAGRLGNGGGRDRGR
jgi:two-component system sensor histidine kinase KdpD